MKPKYRDQQQRLLEELSYQESVRQNPWLVRQAGERFIERAPSKIKGRLRRELQAHMQSQHPGSSAADFAREGGIQRGM